jgi:hypothetical protein
MIPRRTPVRRKRPGLRKGELTKAEKSRRREFIYELSGGMCELKLPGCKQQWLPYEGDVRDRWHLVHMRHKRRFGWPIEGEHRMRGGCFTCHSLMHNTGRKPNDYPVL